MVFGPLRSLATRCWFVEPKSRASSFCRASILSLISAARRSCWGVRLNGDAFIGGQCCADILGHCQAGQIPEVQHKRNESGFDRATSTLLNILCGQAALNTNV